MACILRSLSDLGYRLLTIGNCSSLPAAAAAAAVMFAAGCQTTTAPAPPSLADTPTQPALAPSPAPTPAPQPPSSASAPSDPSIPSSPDARAYVFGWGDQPGALARPRGGTTHGAPVTFAPAQSPPTAISTNRLERDRAAILSLAGNYRVSFHFMETLGLSSNYQPTPPYHSWATEKVRVIEDRGNFISLQHILVMFFAHPDGSVSSPSLVKHWRQDWTYEDKDLHTFRGAATWERRRPDTAEAYGAWSQAVFQVDDSPRYEALGRWEHRGNLSIWTGDNELRPLPRREFTVRKDYGVMEGQHRIILTPTGWLHEQQNWKRVAGDSDGQPPRYIAAEFGLDRYERISAPSLADADQYWQKTSGYWAAVRRVWSEEMAKRDRFTLNNEVDGKKLFEHHFDYAEKLEAGQPFNAADAERHARATIQSFIKE